MSRRDNLGKYYGVEDEYYDDSHSSGISKFRRDRDEDILRKKDKMKKRQQKRRQKRNERWEE